MISYYVTNRLMNEHARFHFDPYTHHQVGAAVEAAAG